MQHVKENFCRIAPDFYACDNTLSCRRGNPDCAFYSRRSARNGKDRCKYTNNYRECMNPRAIEDAELTKRIEEL